MEYRRLGKSGLKVSALSFGSWVTFGDQVDTSVAEACMKAAYDAGVNFFDNAEAYAGGQSELMMGEILERFGWDRDSYVVSSKVFFGAGKKGPNQTGLSRKHVREACDQALQRLRVDYLDLYFCHRADPETPIEETVLAMNDLIRSGKILYWGTSEWSAQQIQEAATVARDYRLIGPTMEQPQYHMFHRDRVEKEYAPLYSGVGIGTTIWSPLASGLLTGKYNDGIPEGSRASLPAYQWLRKNFEGDVAAERIAKVRKLADVAGDLGVSLPKMALAWCMKNPNVSTVITGASRAEQVTENMGAIDVVPLLTDDVMERIDGILEG